MAGHLIWRGLARLRWPLSSLVALLVIVACVVAIPQWLVDWELGASTRTLTAVDRAKAINDVRATLLQGIAGAVLLLGAYFTYRQLQTSRESQVTERFTRAIEQLGHAELDVRLGGIYALERIANDSPDDRTTIAEVLTALVRGHAPWPPRLPGQYVAEAPIKQVPELQVQAPDVQAAVTVLARRPRPPKRGGYLDLHATDLRKAYLNEANFHEVNLSHSNLQEASLVGAQLPRANLVLAQLQSAILLFADLRSAWLSGAQLQRADLWKAWLPEALLDGANLEGANLFGANLREANLTGANLEGANLTGAQLGHARTDSKTVWPAGFDPGHAGVVLTTAGPATQTNRTARGAFIYLQVGT